MAFTSLKTTWEELPAALAEQTRRMPEAERQEWVKRMRALSESLEPLPYRVDDSRQSIIDEVIP